MADFSHFIAIDWSGAKGARHKSIAVGLCKPGFAAPKLIANDQPWSRTGVADWLLSLAQSGARPLIGFDFSFAPPFDTSHGYFRHNVAPRDAVTLWHHVDALCEDEDLGAASFIERHHRRDFYLGAADGIKADYMRLRHCEHRFNALGGGKPSSIFDCIGAAQVAKASFAGMRLLHRLRPHLAIWPFAPPAGACVVEIYTRAFIRLAGLSGRKVRDAATLDLALAALGSRPADIGPKVSDHASDALIAAAGLRAIASEQAYWQPPGLTRAIARTEGWTFGVV